MMKLRKRIISRTIFRLKGYADYVWVGYIGIQQIARWISDGSTPLRYVDFPAVHQVAIVYDDAGSKRLRRLLFEAVTCFL